MSSNELLSRKSKYSDKQYENSSVCNRSVKSEFNNLSIDLPKQRSKYTTIEKEIISKQQNHQHFIINLTSNPNNTKIQNIPSCKKFVALKISTGKYKISERPKIGISSGVIQVSPTKYYKKCHFCKGSTIFLQ